MEVLVLLKMSQGLSGPNLSLETEVSTLTLNSSQSWSVFTVLTDSFTAEKTGKKNKKILSYLNSQFAAATLGPCQFKVFVAKLGVTIALWHQWPVSSGSMLLSLEIRRALAESQLLPKAPPGPQQLAATPHTMLCQPAAEELWTFYNLGTFYNLLSSVGQHLLFQSSALKNFCSV